MVVVYSGIALFAHSTILRRGDLSVNTGNVKPLSTQHAAEQSVTQFDSVKGYSRSLPVDCVHRSPVVERSFFV